MEPLPCDTSYDHYTNKKKQLHLILDNHQARTNIDRTSFRYYAVFKRNDLQNPLKLESYISLRDCKALLSDVFCFFIPATLFLN